VSSNDNTKQLVSSVMTTTSPIEQIYIYDNPVTQPSIEQNLIFSNLNTESLFESKRGLPIVCCVLDKKAVLNGAFENISVDSGTGFEGLF
jgi:hypothetical protein